MNEHLTNLYRSCRTKEALASQDQYNSANVLIGTEIEKFAELIVRECINNYRRKHGEYLRTGRYIDEYEHSNNMLTELGFKEHFGVKE